VRCSSGTGRWTVLALAAIGAAFLVWSAVIHLELWGDGYRDISVIGPLFLAQGIDSAALALRDGGFLGPPGIAGANGDGDRMVCAEDPLGVRKEKCELVAGGDRMPGQAGPVGEVVTGDESIGVIGAQNALPDWQERGQLLTGGGRVSAFAGPAGKFVAGKQCGRVVGS
jgi:hypothetical protein